jgi:hypothetical protein
MKKLERKVHDPILEEILKRYPKKVFKEPPKTEKVDGRKKK